MSRGVVLWPDDHTSGQVRSLWSDLLDRGLPSVASQATQIPHVSLIVADDLAVAEALEAIGPVPTTAIPLLIESLAVISAGHLLLTCTPTGRLLSEHRRVHRAALPHARNAWSHYAPDAWLPHLTLGRSFTSAELAVAIPILLERLPINGSLTSGGIEDGESGERWPAAAAS